METASPTPHWLAKRMKCSHLTCEASQSQCAFIRLFFSERKTEVSVPSLWVSKGGLAFTTWTHDTSATSDYSQGFCGFLSSVSQRWPQKCWWSSAVMLWGWAQPWHQPWTSQLYLKSGNFSQKLTGWTSGNSWGIPWRRPLSIVLDNK